MECLYRNFHMHVFWMVRGEMVFSGIFQRAIHESPASETLVEFIRNVCPWAPPRSYWIRTSGVGFGVSNFSKRSQVVLMHIKAVKLWVFTTHSKFSKTLFPIFALAIALAGQDSLAWAWTPLYWVSIMWNRSGERVWFSPGHNLRPVCLCEPLMATSFSVGGEESESWDYDYDADPTGRCKPQVPCALGKCSSIGSVFHFPLVKIMKSLWINGFLCFRKLYVYLSVTSQWIPKDLSFLFSF